jgi:hypothetical protein
MIYAYTAYGLVLHLCFPCSALPTVPLDADEATGATPDVVVSEGMVPRSLDRPLYAEMQWQVEPGRFLWRGGPRSGRFLVEDGRRVTLQRNPGAEEEFLGFHFIRSVLAAVLRQRGLLTLHASTVATPAGAVTVCGRSGAGKSTTVSALMARGNPLLSDDLTALSPAPDGGVLALPGAAQLYLCEDAMQGLEPDTAALPFHSLGRLKVPVRPQQPMPNQAVPLRAIHLLETHSGDGLRVRALCGAERFAALQECVYGPLLPAEHQRQFGLFATVAEQVAVYRIDRPAERRTVDEIAAIVLGSGG